MIDIVQEDKIVQYVKSLCTNNSSGHDWYHIERVCKLAKYIGEKEGADLDIVIASALLHDIGFSREMDSGVDHADESARMAEDFLEKIGFEISKVDKVVYAIKFHRYGKKVKPNILEVKVLQDADRLDALGAIGIARAFAYGGARGAPMYNPMEDVEEYNPLNIKSTITHFQEKLLKIKEKLNTDTAREIGMKRHEFMEKFLEEFYAEMDCRK